LAPRPTERRRLEALATSAIEPEIVRLGALRAIALASPEQGRLVAQRLRADPAIAVSRIAQYTAR